MAILGRFPPNLVFLIGILEPVKWTATPSTKPARPKRIRPVKPRKCRAK